MEKGRTASEVQAVGQAPLTELRAEMRRRTREIRALERQRERLLGRIREIERKIIDLSGTNLRPGAAHRVVTLAEVLEQVLRGTTMSVAEAADAALRAGYQTRSQHFTTQVNMVLARNGRFERVGRGRYTAASAR